MEAGTAKMANDLITAREGRHATRKVHEKQPAEQSTGNSKQASNQQAGMEEKGDGWWEQ